MKKKRENGEKSQKMKKKRGERERENREFYLSREKDFLTKGGKREGHNSELIIKG